MKALICSDSHHSLVELEELQTMYKGKVDVMFHCGDSELEVNHPAIEGMQIVRGNCDYESGFPNERVETVDDVTFYVTHGHLFNVNHTLQNVYYRAKEAGAAIALFGHTHVRGAELVDDVLMINPGSVLLPRQYREKSYALLEVNGQNAHVQFKNMSHETLAEAEFSFA